MKVTERKLTPLRFQHLKKGLTFLMNLNMSKAKGLLKGQEVLTHQHCHTHYVLGKIFIDKNKILHNHDIIDCKMLFCH